MRRLFIAGPAIALTMTLVALAQKPEGAAAKPADDKAATEKSKSLEELLVKALQNSPDVQVAEARLKEAEAALRQARLLVAQKTVDLQQNLDSKQKELSRVEALFGLAAKARETGSISATEFTKLESELAAQKAVIANVESQVNLLMGKLPGVLDQAAPRAELSLQSFFRVRPAIEAVGLGGSEPSNKRQPQQAMAERLRKLLDKPYKLDKTFEGIPLSELLTHVRESTGAPILTMQNAGEMAVRLDFKGEVPLGAYFQMLRDVTPGLQIYVRDYGFLFIDSDQISPPDDAVSLMEFWHPTNVR